MAACILSEVRLSVEMVHSAIYSPFLVMGNLEASQQEGQGVIDDESNQPDQGNGELKGNEGIFAIHALAKMGYRVWIEEQTIRLRYEGADEPDPAYVATLVPLIKKHKDQVLLFLRGYCPKCGGVVFAPDHEDRSVCFKCDWTPGPMPAKKAEVASGPTCGQCTQFRPSHLNPTQGFGRCAASDLSKRPGAYPGKSACHHYVPISKPHPRYVEKAMHASGQFDREDLKPNG